MALKSCLEVPETNSEDVFTRNKTTALIVRGSSFSYESLTQLCTNHSKNFTGAALLILKMEQMQKQDENVCVHR